MRLHQIVSILIISSGLMSITAFSQTTCSAEKIHEIKRLILPDISLNRDFIENLFNSVESGKLNCQIKTQNNDLVFLGAHVDTVILRLPILTRIISTIN